MAKKLQAIDYTSRDFDSIRRDLESFAKRYYSNTYKDFNEASFGSLMLDTVAYVGDILSFYLDYQANESFLDTAIEYSNVVRLARQFGFKLNTSPSSYGILTFYISVPADSTGTGPDLNYTPVLEAGSEFSSLGGGLYTIVDDVDFKEDNNQIVVGEVDNSTNLPSTYIIRAVGRAVSGRIGRDVIAVGDFQRFRRVDLSENRINNVVSVTDSEGHEYFEVDHLSQNIVYKGVRNVSVSTNNTVKSVLKAVPVARRFVLERTGDTAFLQFGYGSDSELLNESVLDPSNLVLKLNGRNYTTDTGFDPTKLISTDKFGIAPANTTLRISYRVNTTSDVNAAVNSIVAVSRPIIRFKNQGALSTATRQTVIGSLELTNELPFVGDVTLPTSDEVKQRVFGYFATQNRAVTQADYENMIYRMPSKFGSIKRCSAQRDPDSRRRNINIYVISEDNFNNLTSTNSTIKNNLKTWMNNYRMLSDTIDVLDAFIINYGIEFVVRPSIGADRFTLVDTCINILRDKYTVEKLFIGEHIDVADIYTTLSGVEGVLSVSSVKIVNKNGSNYSATQFDINENTSPDGSSIIIPKNAVAELKFPTVDIVGKIK